MSLYTSNPSNACELTAFQKAHKNVQYAQRLLLNPNLNHRYRAISYLRLCCSAIAHYRAQGIELAPELHAKQPYLQLLKDFYQHDALWVTKCEVSHEGRLISSDAEIDHWLKLLEQCTLRIALESTQALASAQQAVPPLSSVGSALPR